MSTFQIIISVVTVVISLASLLGVSVIMKNVWEDKHDEVKAAKKEAQEEARRKRQAEYREVIQQEILVLKTELQKQNAMLHESVNLLKDEVEKLSAKVDRLQHSMVTVDRIMMKMTLDMYEGQGYASASDRAAWNELFKDYKDLGGNHFREYVNEWKRSLEALPNKDDINSERK